MKCHQQHQSIGEKQTQREEETSETQREEETSETQGKASVRSCAEGPTETTPVQFSGVLSPTSSPSHEFTFTLSSVIHSAAETATPAAAPARTNHHQHGGPLAIDLSPADDIFFHGHLLPLHFLSHLHAASPRSSTNSLDSFLVRDSSQEEEPPDNCADQVPNNGSDNIGPNFCTKEAHNKHKPFSLFGLPKWRKGSEPKEKQEKKKVKFDVGEFVKRYVKMVKPLLSPKAGRRDSGGYGIPRQSYSFTGSLTPRVNKREVRGSRGEFSAPASMITSPTNSGRILSTTAGVPSSSTVSDSTMEELQAAIQAAIAHCKDSISAQEKKTMPEILPVPVN